MVIAAIIVGILIAVIIFLLDCINTNSTTANFSDGVVGGIIISILFIIEIGIVGDILASKNPKPTAMDVYQGKTTLEYKVVDNVKVDSVVIFKNDNYGTKN